MSTITLEQQTAIANTLASMHLPVGLGDAESACSIAAINLALTGELSDEIPECMSTVIGHWIIKMQDEMPDAMRNSSQWKTLLPFAAGTGRAHEQERIEVLLNWMCERVLPVLQQVADKHGFGNEWRHMCTERTAASAWAAYKAAVYASDAAAHAADAAAADATATAAHAAAAASADADDAAAADAWSAAVYTAAAAAAAGTADDTWEALDPCGVLELLINKGEK